jgi:hypothetical protein
MYVIGGQIERVFRDALFAAFSIEEGRQAPVDSFGVLEETQILLGKIQNPDAPLRLKSCV